MEEVTAHDEARAWMDARGFRLCLDPLRGGYVEGLDRDAEYEFMRVEWDEPSVFRLSDQPPYFNVWGLRFRPVTE